MEYCEIPDIYYEPAYPRLYETIEHGRALRICVDNEFGSVVSPVILRRIPIETEEPYYDLVTPYGYGGPLITALKGDKAQLIQSFEAAMQAFAAENRVVSEFVRFHPILGNALDFAPVYHSQWDRKTVGADLGTYAIEEEFSRSVLKYVRRAEKAGVTYETILDPSDMKEFKEIYYSTMDRDGASEYYYFGDDYFSGCLRELGKHVLYVKVMLGEKVIAAGLYFVCGEILQCHLSGTLSEYLSLSPAYVTKWATAQWAKANGIRFLHYGGGTSRDPENSLYQFKKKFGQKTEFDFYLGRKIWDPEAYAMLCEKVGANANDPFFPAYRHRS